MSETKKKVAPRDKAKKIFLKTNAVLNGAMRNAGRYIDKDFSELGLQVSETKKKPVWFVRFRDSTGKEQRQSMKRGRAIAIGLADGLLTFDYFQAKAWAINVMQEANKTPEQKAAEKTESEFSTLGLIWERFLKNRRTKNGLPLSRETVKDYQKWYLLALQPARDWKLSKVTVAQWTDFLTDVENKHGKTKALYMMNIISAVYSYSMGLDLLDYNPMAKVRLNRLFIAPPTRDKHLPTIQVKTFYDAIESSLHRRNSREAVTLLLMTGFRLSAGLGLRWKQLNLEQGYYFVQPGQAGWKGFTGVVPLSDFVVGLLKARRERLGEQSPYVFPKRHGDGDPPHLSSVDGALVKIAEIEGLPKLCAHDLRRTFATLAKYVFKGEIDKVGMLLAHKWAVNDKNMVVTENLITQQYIQSELVSLRAVANEASSFILELAEVQPMTEKTKARLMDAGYNGSHFQLLELPEDEEEEALLKAA